MGTLLLAVLLPYTAFSETKIFPSNKHDLKSYQTYQWKNPPRVISGQSGDEKGSPYEGIIRDAVNKQLAAKGYKEVASGGDLQIVSGAVAAKANQLEGYLVTMGFDAYWGYWFGMPYPVNSVNRVGVLFVGFVDAKSNEGVWAGFDSEGIDRAAMDVQAGKAKIEKAASKLFKKFPSRS